MRHPSSYPTFNLSATRPDSADPSFQDYLQDQGQTKVFFHFGSLKNSMGTSRLSPGPECATRGSSFSADL
jgi:hypothetical protein